MAELTATLLQEFRRESAKLYANEFRMGQYGAMYLFLDAARRNALISPEVRAEALGSTGNTIKIIVMKDNANAAVATSRSCTPVNNRTDSALQTVSFSSIADGFTMYPTEYDTNEVKYQQHYNANMISMLRRIRKKIDDLCLANLSTNKTAVLKNNLGYSFANSVLAAGWEDRMDIIGDIEPLMLSNDFDGQLRIVGNAGLLSLYNKLMEHGTYNDVNKAMEIAGKELYITNGLTEQNTYGAFYAVAGNQVDLLSRVSRAEYHGITGPGHEFGMTTLPGLEGLTFGYHTVESIGDIHSATGQADQICDKKVEYGFSIDLAFVNAYESDASTNGTGILKGTIASGTRGVQTIVPATGAVFNTKEVTEPSAEA